jgi:hypothetical protein
MLAPASHQKLHTSSSSASSSTGRVADGLRAALDSFWVIGVVACAVTANAMVARRSVNLLVIVKLYFIG